MEDRVLETPFPDVGIEDLRRPVLTGLCVGCLTIAWIWVTATGILSTESNLLPALTPPLVLMATSTLCLGLRTLSLPVRSALLLVGMAACLYLGYRTAPGQIWLYYLSLIVTVTGLLTGPGKALITALALTLIVFRVLWLGASPATSLPQILPPLGLLWATAIATWLSSRNLYTALWWALDSQQRAWQTAEEVRERRAQLRRTLDSLRTTYELLERTSRELDAARREAEEARTIKSRFVANISHELRTPLNVIVGFAEMLCVSPQSYGDFPWPPPLRQDVLTIWRNGEHLLKMVDDVLDLAQIEAARLPVTPEPTDLLQLIRDTIVTASALLRNSGLELRVHLPDALPLLDLDATRIRQVLLNLVNNAIRFTKRGYIEVGAALHDEEVFLHVKDSGEGIPSDRLESIFEEFEQVDTSIRRPHQGAGLGLTISRHFVRLHGGRIWAESALGEGSTFYFALPLSRAAATPLLTSRQRRQQTRLPKTSPSVVTLCQDPLAVRLLERYAEGVSIMQASSVEETVDLVRQHHPAALLIASNSPETLEQSVEQAQAMLDALKTFDLPAVVCSIPTERRAGAALGVAEFLIKPVTRADLLTAIERVNNAPRRLLVVDDEADMRRLLVRTLQLRWESTQIVEAGSGAEALALLGQRPDVILLDLLMPGMSGVETLQALRANPATAAIPIVVITARGPAESLMATRRSEVHILKNGGYAAGELVRLVTAVIGNVPAHYARGAGATVDTPIAAPA
jgi:signal transduction histidine kinase/CheY-like chemotaxis protein